MGMREPGGTWRRGARIASRPSGWPVLRTPKWMLAAGVRRGANRDIEPCLSTPFRHQAMRRHPKTRFPGARGRPPPPTARCYVT